MHPELAGLRVSANFACVECSREACRRRRAKAAALLPPQAERVSTWDGKPKPCECGCGLDAPLARVTRKERNQWAGEPVRFIRGHQGRRFHLDRLTDYGVRTASGCLLWPGSKKGSSGYAAVFVEDKMVRVSRLTLQAKLGRELRDNEEACHTCDNPACFEADHLFAASHRENMLDAAAKGRLWRGGHPSALRLGIAS